jgi:predicted lactoylglutathione lyase
MAKALNAEVVINLPVADLARSTVFFKAIGLKHDSNFSDSESTCLFINDHCSVVLFTRGGYSQFCKKPIADASKTSEVVVSLNVSSLDEVDEIADAAIESGGKETLRGSRTDSIYRRVFDDLDSHSWEIFWYK